ncbi:Imm26 family immunity protein [Rhodopirellula sp. SWK7]|uniref:Imm26 family immunity protein n=1 Tax=Rhodopirellula sp. SWK7 TaxID=595460 RepID=UPI0005C6B096
MDYPLVPKSTSKLSPGQYWAVPMANGRFACGRVLQLNTEEIPTKTRGFFGGLHDWVGDTIPTADAIAKCGLIAYGVMHIKAITTTGGAVLGERDLSLDEIEMPRMISAHGGAGTMLLDGSTHLRLATRDEWGAFPVIGCWGYNFITQIADRKLAD